MNSQAPLAGVRVLDMSRILAGPVCGQLLADLGADVVKVERPGAGDDTRQWGPPFVPDGGPSAYYLSCNRGKRSITIDLSVPAGLELVHQLLSQADILIENFLAHSLAKMGLSTEQLQSRHPHLVVCSISGYGRTGPLKDVPGYDLVIQAMSGLMGITGEPDGRPMKVGVALADVLTGLYAACCACAGLAAKRKGGGAQHYDLSLLDCTLSSLVNVIQGTLVTGQPPARFGNAHPQIVPYESFATADGHLVLAVGNDRQWERFCQLAGKPSWAATAAWANNPGRVKDRAHLIPLIQELMQTRSTAAWQSLLAEADIPHGPVLRVDEALELPQTQARGLIAEVEDDQGRPFRLLRSPVQWPGERAREVKAPPTLGADTQSVLQEWLNIGDEQFTQLQTQRVLGE